MFYECDLIEQRSDLAAMVARRDVAGSSFAFVVHEDEWGLYDGYPLRTLISGRIIDLAPTNDPAYEQTSVSMRSLAEYVNADGAEVRKSAETGDLAAFFKRTDLPSGKVPKTPLTRAELRFKQVRKTIKQRQVELMGVAAVVPQPNTAAQRRKQLTDMRYGPQRRAGGQ